MLVDACIEIVRDEGLTAVTPQRVAKAAGISAPGFYKHFRNVDDLLGVALGDLFEQKASQQSATRLVEITGMDDSPPSVETVRGVLDSMLAVFVSDPRFAELYLRYLNDPTMLGGVVTRFAARVRDDTVAVVWRKAQSLGVPPADYARVAAYAEHALAVYYHAGEMLLSGRYERPLVIDTTARALLALTEAFTSEVAPSA